ncbi:MAG: hypothetical protein KGJ78_05295 [Alphaproteobacteria bacterium]|nr:hypothetical protein [Alphaproteobacteria bacterium]
MKTRSFAPALALILAACAQDARPAHGMVMATTIVITNSGGTNLIGYRVLITPEGKASYVSGEGSGEAVLPAAMRDRLMRDIAAAKPLAQLPGGRSCMKPVSFGTSTYIAVGGDRSPDLSCPGNDATQALENDVAAITATLHVRNVPRSQGHELPPVNY